MIVGVPKEITTEEYRVAMTLVGVDCVFAPPRNLAAHRSDVVRGLHLNSRVVGLMLAIGQFLFPKNSSCLAPTPVTWDDRIVATQSNRGLIWDLAVLFGVAMFLSLLPINMLIAFFDWPPPPGGGPNGLAIGMCVGILLIVVGIVGRKIFVPINPPADQH